MSKQRPATPFPATVALNTDMLLHPAPSNTANTPQPPVNNTGGIDHLPGDPRIPLTQTAIHTFLSRELSTPVLDELYPYVWLLASKAGDNITPLHRQAIKGREILPAEDVRLHLIWNRDKIYIKPLPACLLNHTVWERYLPLHNPTTHPLPVVGFDRRVALGFLRSYAFLIRYPVDLKIAREIGLISEDLQHLTWSSWVKFISCFENIPDSDVAERYHYGHLRLGRLNWAIRFIQPLSARSKWFYLQPYWSIPVLLEGMFNYLLFGFATVSLVLSAMQVALAVPLDGMGGGFGISEGYVIGLTRLSWVFASMVLFASFGLWIGMVVVPGVRVLWKGYLAVRRNR
jgi:hypothetical protein